MFVGSVVAMIFTATQGNRQQRCSRRTWGRDRTWIRLLALSLRRIHLADSTKGRGIVSGALSGIRVIEVGRYVTAAQAGLLLADLGADVVKVEHPVGGDPLRDWPGTPQFAPHFRSLNRNKKSIALDISTATGRQVLLRLLGEADVLIENFRPGQTEKWGWGFDALHERNHRLVYCSITGFGPTGPYRDRPGYDTMGVALSGLMSVLTDIRNPQLLGMTLADLLTGMYAAYGVLGALLNRERTGEGQLVETSLLRSCMAFMGGVAAEFLEFGVSPTFPEIRSASAAWPLVAGDGKPFAVHLSSAPKFWERFAKIIGRPELVTDPRFATAAARREHFADLSEILRSAARLRPRSEWLDTLVAADVPCSPVNTIEEAFADPQVMALQMKQSFTHRERGEFELVAPGVTMNMTPLDGLVAAPLLGENSGDVLRQAGFSDDEIAQLGADGIAAFNDEIAASSVNPSSAPE